MDGVDSVGLRDDVGGGRGGDRVDEVSPGELEVVVDARVSPLEASGDGDAGDLSGAARLDPSEGLDHGDVDGVVADRVSEVKEEVPGGHSGRSDDVSSWRDRESDRISDDKDVGEPGRPGDGELDGSKGVERTDDTPESSCKASSATPAYNSFMSEFDDYVINEKNNLAESSAQNALRYGYNVGDMVWGKVKSHPWWPGHIFNEAFASSSVRKSRRDGSVLVAFFGDSSYGWFDPLELIPFETNFAEKSKQTTSRAFTKAVEEAVDEAGRRRGLGLACKCRNPNSFRPTSVRGYFTVDIPDYEPGSVYSVNQIAKARERFNPLEALSFVKRLALAPKHHDPESLDAIENKSTVFAYRKAIFEEFDETYAQAFGVQAARPSHNSSDVQLAKEPSRAPLSGPLVIAEALVGAGASAKSAKVKDHSKKEKYLLKRRDEYDVPQINRIPGPAPSSAANKEGLTVSATGGYVLQKRSTSHINAETTHDIEQSQSAGGATLSQQYAGEDAVAQQLPANRTDMTGRLFDYAQSSGDLMGPPPKHGDIAEKTDVSSPRYDPNSIMKVVARAPSVVTAEMKSRKVEGCQGQNPVPDGVGISYQSIADAKRTKFKADGAVKKTKKILIGPGAENIGVKKKLKRKEMDSQDVSDHPKKQLLPGKAGASMQKIAGKKAQIEAAKKIEGKGSLAFSRLLPVAGSGKDLQQLLTSLQVLAIDHGAFDKSIRAVTKRSFLGFRSLVYEKSLVLAPPTETNSSLTQPTKAQAEVGAPDPSSKGLMKTGVSSQPSNGVIKKPRSIKTVKPGARPDVGQKRPLSDFQEAIEAKRIKRMNDLKSLAAGKRAAQKVQDTPSREAKDAASAVPSKATKSLPSKKIERPRARVSAPTMLVMKFPPGFSLPSVPELKARFARFGPLDSSRIQVLWNSLTCRVVFQHKSDAEAAHNYAVGNGSLFGSASVRYHIRDAGALASEAAEAAKGRGEDDSLRTNEPLATHSHSHPLVQPSPPLQLKSCLKKPPGDASGPVTGSNGSRGARVKFVLGGEETDRQEKAMASSLNSNAVVNGSGSASYVDGAASSSSVGTVINSKAFQKRLPVESGPYQMPPLLPNPPQRPQPGNGQQSYSGGASTVGMGMQQNASNRVDISQQMISLLTRCNDVVKDLSGLLGYIPYHPL